MWFDRLVRKKNNQNFSKTFIIVLYLKNNSKTFLWIKKKNKKQTKKFFIFVFNIKLLLNKKSIYMLASKFIRGQKLMILLYNLNYANKFKKLIKLIFLYFKL